MYTWHDVMEITNGEQAMQLPGSWTSATYFYIKKQVQCFKYIIELCLIYHFLAQNWADCQCLSWNSIVQF